MNKGTIASALLILILASRGMGATWEVPGEVASIGAALAQCAAGDTVLVDDGVYSGPENRGLLINTFDVTLRSRGGPEACTIDCEEQDRWLNIGGTLTRETVIEGFRVIRGSELLGGAIAIITASPTIRNCVFEANRGTAGGALISIGQDVLVEDCRFHANDAGITGQGGAVFAGWHQITLVHCLFDHNRAGYAGAIEGQADTQIHVWNCTLSGNLAYEDAGAIETGSAQFDLRQCIVYGNTCLGHGPDEIHVINQTIEPQCCDIRMAGVDAEGWSFTDCFDADPLFCDAADWDNPDYPSDYHLRSDSPCLPGTSICGELVGSFDQGCLEPGIGACCVGLTCSLRTEDECAQVGGVFLGGGTFCEPNPCLPIPALETSWGRIKARFK